MLMIEVVSACYYEYYRDHGSASMPVYMPVLKIKDRSSTTKTLPPKPRGLAEPDTGATDKEETTFTHTSTTEQCWGPDETY